LGRKDGATAIRGGKEKLTRHRILGFGFGLVSESLQRIPPRRRLNDPPSLLHGSTRAQPQNDARTDGNGMRFFSLRKTNAAPCLCNDATNTICENKGQGALVGLLLAATNLIEVLGYRRCGKRN